MRVSSAASWQALALSLPFALALGCATDPSDNHSLPQPDELFVEHRENPAELHTIDDAVSMVSAKLQTTGVPEQLTVRHRMTGRMDSSATNRVHIDVTDLTPEMLPAAVDALLDEATSADDFPVDLPVRVYAKNGPQGDQFDYELMAIAYGEDAPDAVVAEQVLYVTIFRDTATDTIVRLHVDLHFQRYGDLENGTRLFHFVHLAAPDAE